MTREPGGRETAQHGSDKHPLAQMILIGIVASAVGVVIALLIDWFPTQSATAAGDIDTLFDVLLICSVPIFVLVMTIAIYCVWRFRAKPGETGDGPPIHGNTRLEIFWVTVPFILVSGLAIYGWIVLNDIEAAQPDEMVVEVKGEQFTWTFEYPEQEVTATELVLPRDQPVKFDITTKDVIHSFWVPEFRLKQDAVPGMTTNIRLTPNRVGRWSVVCAELCGIGHATMRQSVRVVPPGEFESWIEQQRERAGDGEGGEADGAQVFTAEGCGACHTLADAGTSADVGPNLDELPQVADRRRPGTSAEEYVEEAIVDPDAFVVEGFPEGVMPGDLQDRLSPEQIDALVEYLLAGGQGG